MQTRRIDFWQRGRAKRAGHNVYKAEGRNAALIFRHLVSCEVLRKGSKRDTVVETNAVRVATERAERSAGIIDMFQLPDMMRKVCRSAACPIGAESACRMAAAYAVLWVVSLGLGERAAPAAECTTFRVREQDQVWLVSTRHLGCDVTRQPSFQVWRYQAGWWQPASEAEFFAADSADVITPLYVHGNRIDSALAGQFGLQVYFELVGKLNDEPPARFVIWSWPADQIKGPLNDVRTKAARSDYEAFFLATFLSRMQPDVRVGLVGYSFGARIASGAMHLLGGGSMFGYIVPASPGRPYRVAMWAAAEHSHWYLAQQFHSHALPAADAWYVTMNPCDQVLARYRFVDHCGDPCAVGYAGIYGRNLLPPDANARIEEVNVSNIVGSEHHWRPYLYSRYIQDRTRDYILWRPLGPGEPATPAAVAAVP